VHRLRCQARTVWGWTNARTLCHPRSSRESHTQKKRSVGRNRGRATIYLYTANLLGRRHLSCMAQRAWKSEGAKASRAGMASSRARSLRARWQAHTGARPACGSRRKKDSPGVGFSGRTGGLRRHTSQTFFELTTLQFSLRDGNVHYDAIDGTSTYRLLHFQLDCVERAGGTPRRTRAYQWQPRPQERRRQET